MKTFSSSIVNISCISCIACIVCISCISQAQVVDEFSDGNFSRNPQWLGDTMQFEVNTAGQLHLKAQGSDTSLLLTRSEHSPTTEWRFWMKLSFNTSSNNYARIYLASDTMNVFSAMNGYFLQAGGGDDSIFIIKQSGMVQEKIYRVQCFKTLHSTNTLRMKITRDEAGSWQVMIDTTGGFYYYTDGRFSDNSIIPARWVGVYCRYTSSNATKFYFDDFYIGPIIYDTIAPSVVSQDVQAEKVIKVAFSETVEKIHAETLENYQLGSDIGYPDSVIMDVQEPTVTLFLHEPMKEGVNGSLQIQGVTDLAGNRMKDTVVPVCWYRPKVFDILIHEIMADPDPPVELPDGEFVELFNRTDFPINLKGWSFSYGSYKKVFPSTVISPKGYLLIVKDSAYLTYAACVFLFTSSTSLSNEGTLLVLNDQWNHVIHAVSYNQEWYKGSFKGDGGWSLEMIDPLNPCGCGENWGASQAKAGGTPGNHNSIGKSNPDLKSPVPMRAVISDSSSLEVYFSEAMDSTSMLSLSGWVIGSPDGVIHPVRAEPVSPGFISTKLLFSKAFEPGISYTLRVSGDFKDCTGNYCDTTRAVRFAIPDSVTLHDIVINEILSNPASGGARFVELMNRSEKIIDLQTLVLANRDTVIGFLPGSTPLFSSGYLLFPGDYIALTSSPYDILDRYHSPFPEAIVSMQGFPVFGDDTGTVILARKDNLMVIDRIHYDPDMHYPLLATSEGVSLERTNPDMPSESKDNWHSCAETSGFATPGFINSHFVIHETTDREIVIEPCVFSPDNDGHDDLLSIIVRENDPDCTVSIEIYDSKGRIINHLVNNVLTGSEGIFIWDGMTSNKNKAPLGFYVFLIEITRPDGTVKHFKRTAVLGGRL